MERFLGMDGQNTSEIVSPAPRFAPTLGVAGAVSEQPAHLPTGYEILEELGRGGMGVVYKARHIRLNRVVALKMILSGGLAGPTERIRFLAEAEAVAALQHPQIVSLLDFGEHRGQPFFTLEFIPGGSLACKLKGVTYSPREAARLLEQLAEGIYYAHTRGIVHRDLKPANVLLAADGAPKITDFGLARRVEGGTGFTATGDVLGTPSYMAPEQASGESKHAGPAADVYALGTILYECLTGRPPFRESTIVETVLKVVKEEPVSVRQIQPHTPVDLATICHKCLQKDPNKRYTSALELAQDCAAFLAGKPIRARPVGAMERGWRWCRRNPVVAGLLTLVILVLLTGTGVATAFAIQAQNELRKAEQAAKAEAQAKYETGSACQRVQEQFMHSGLEASLQNEQALALLWFTCAVQEGGDDAVHQELNRIRVANWQRQIYRPMLAFSLPGFRRGLDHFEAFEYHPEGRYLLALTSFGRCAVWDLERSSELPLPGNPRKFCAAAWDGKASRLALATPQGEIELYSFPAMKELARMKFDGAIRTLAFSPDGKLIACGMEDGVRLWDIQGPASTTRILEHPKAVESINFSPTGNLLLTSCADKKARIFAVGSDSITPLFEPVPHAPYLRTPGTWPRFIESGSKFFTITRSSLQWRDADTGRKIKNISDEGNVNGVAVGPEGRWLAALWDSGAGKIWDFDNDSEAANFTHRHEGAEEMVGFDKTGETIATCGIDSTMCLWSAKNGSRKHYPLLHSQHVVRLRFSPAGPFVATAQWDGEIRVWKLPEGPPLAYQLPTGGACRVVFSPDKRYLLPGGISYRNGKLQKTRVHEAVTGNPAGPMLEPGGIIVDASFSPDQRFVATAGSTADTQKKRDEVRFLPDGRAGNIQIWDWRTGNRCFDPINMPTEPRGLAYSPDGKTIAVACGDGWVVLVDAETGTVRQQLDSGVRSKPWQPNFWIANGMVRFSLDGRFLASWEMGHDVFIWDAHSGQCIHTLAHGDRIDELDFSRDSALLATTSRDSCVRVWDLRTGGLVSPDLNHLREAYAVRFDEVENRLLSGGRDGVMRFWDWRRVSYW